MKKLRLLSSLRAVCLLGLALCISTNLFGQITITAENQTIRSIITQIERGSDYGFFYSDAVPDLELKRSIKFENAPVESVLNELFSGTEIAYTIRSGNQIMLYAAADKKAKEQSSVQAKPANQTPHTIKGRVFDPAGAPLLAVTVLEEGTTNGTITNNAGEYVLTITGSLPAKVIFEYVGYTPEERTVTASTTTINISLTESATVMEDLVVVGYGTQKRVNLTGSVASVKVDEAFSDRPVTNVSTGLAGLVPGLAAAQSSGEAGNNSAELLIRGLGTINNAEPLIVIDGMPGLTLDRVNMDDIESISVLKDAAASAVYGARAANGVILITSKSGKNAHKSSVRFSTQYALSEPTNTFHFMTDYARAMYLQQRKAGVSMMLDDIPFKDGTVDEWLAMQMIDPFLYPNTDWWDIIMRTGVLKKYNLSATGKTDHSNFYASFGIQDEQGQRINNSHDRYNARFNYDYNITKNINIGVRFDGSWTTTSTSSMGNIWTSVAGIYPYDPETGRYGGPMAYGESISTTSGSSSYTLNNPLAMLNSTIVSKNRQEANVSGYLDWSPVKGLKATVDYVMHYYNSFAAEAFMPTGPAWNFQTDTPTELVYISDNAGIKNSAATGWRSQLTARLDYNTTIADNHDLSALALYSEESSFSRSLAASRDERIDPSLSELNAALLNTYTNSGTSARSGLRSFVGRINYAAHDRYLFELNARFDGYSRFTRGHQWGFFPSASVGWRFSEEEFFEELMPEWFSNGKFRASYGSVGNNTGVANYQQLNTLTNTKYYEDDQIVSGFTATSLINENLTWETSTILDIGVELAFFKNKLTFEADYYDRLTSGMIQASEKSILISALSTPQKNMADLRNRGFEVNVAWNDKINRDWRYSVSFNFSYNASCLLSWNEYLDVGNIWVGMPYGFTYMYHDTGYINQTWMDTYKGVPQSKFPGDLLLEDVNGDGQVNRYDMVAYPAYNTARPTTNYGLITALSWKGLSLNMQLQGTFGRMANWRTDYNNFNFPNTGYAVTWDHWNNTWSYDNRYGGWPRAGGGQASANMETTRYWFDDMSYLRLKNLSLSYSLPKKYLKSLGVGGLRLVFSGTNLLTFTSFRGIDPEKADINDLYPLNKTYSFGITLDI